MGLNWRAILLVLVLGQVGNSTHAGVVTFDNIGAGTYFLFPNDPQGHRGASAIQLTTAPASQVWKIEEIFIRPFVSGAGVLATDVLSGRIKVWANYDRTNTTNVFSGLLSDRSFNFGTRGASSAPLLRANYLANGWSFTSNDSTIAVEVELFRNGGTSNIASTFRDVLPTTGTALGNYYYDTNQNGTYQANENFSQSARSAMALRISASAVSAVPEPSTLIAGIVVVGGLWVKRRRRKVVA